MNELNSHARLPSCTARSIRLSPGMGRRSRSFAVALPMLKRSWEYRLFLGCKGGDDLLEARIAA